MLQCELQVTKLTKDVYNRVDRTSRLTKYNDGTALATGVYDAVGNLANHRDVGAVVYDAENRMTQVTAGSVSTYRYDGEGRRVTGGVRWTYVYDAMAGWRRRLGTAGNGISYLTADQLGSTRVVTNASGVRTMCADYLPGEQITTGVRVVRGRGRGAMG